LNEVEENYEMPELYGPAKPCLLSVASALVLEIALGLGEAVILSFFVGLILTIMGFNVVS